MSYNRFDYSRIEHLRDSLDLYIEHKRLPGDFLTGVLEDSISKAVSHADETNVELIPILNCWLYNEAPGGSWGSPEKVRAWVSGEKEGGFLER